MKLINVLNVYIYNITTLELLENLNKFGGFVVTPNVDHLVKLQNDYDFLKAYRLSNYRTCDSRILQYTSNFLGTPIKEKISGSDLFPEFYNYNKNNEEIKIFLLGGLEGVAKTAQLAINEKLGREIIIDSYSPSFGFEKNEQECQEIIERVNNSGATVLAVGVGAPKQEKWIAKYKNHFKNVKIFLAIGATIDFEAGKKPRSPKWISNVGLEWAYRIISEPSRLWKRYLVDSIPVFIQILQQKLNLYKISPVMELYCLPIGQLLEQAGLITSEQVEKVLYEQKYHFSGKRFGEILDNWGWVKKATIDFFLEELPVLLVNGEIIDLKNCLKRAELLDDEQIRSILQKQSETKLGFAEIAVKEGWLKQKTIAWLIRLGIKEN